VADAPIEWSCSPRARWSRTARPRTSSARRPHSLPDREDPAAVRDGSRCTRSSGRSHESDRSESDRSETVVQLRTRSTTALLSSRLPAS
jgi:hypothetical protein